MGTDDINLKLPNIFEFFTNTISNTNVLQDKTPSNMLKYACITERELLLKVKINFVTPKPVTKRNVTELTWFMAT